MLDRIIFSKDKINMLRTTYSFLKESFLQKNGENILTSLEELGDEFNIVDMSAKHCEWWEPVSLAFIFYQASLSVAKDNKWKINNFIQKTKADCINRKIAQLESQVIRNIRPNYVQKISTNADCRNQLLKLRQHVNAKINAIYNLYPKNDKKYNDYLSKVFNSLYKESAKGIKQLIELLIQECIDILGPPPCEYAFIGFGSLHNLLFTLYSDIEFAILLKEGKDNEVNRQYYRELTYLLHFKVINLGETPIPHKLFNDSFFDVLTGAGFCFDLGGVTPLNRWYDGKGREPDICELIGEPLHFINYIEDNYWGIRRNLPKELISCTHITGDDRLTQRYYNLLRQHFQKIDKNGNLFCQNRAMQLMLGNDNWKGDMQLHRHVIYAPLEKLSYDVKKDIYRPLQALITDVSIFFGISSLSIRKQLKELHNKGILNESLYEAFKNAVGIIQILRLKTYFYYAKQRNDFKLLTGVRNQEMTLFLNKSDNALIKYLNAVFFCFYNGVKHFTKTLNDSYIPKNEINHTLTLKLNSQMHLLPLSFENNITSDLIFKNKNIAKRIFGFFDQKTLKTSSRVSKNFRELTNEIELKKLSS